MIWGYPHLAAGYSPTKHLEILSCALWKPQIYPAGSCGFLAVCDGDLTDNEDPQIWLWRVQYVDFPWPKDEVLTGISLFQWEFQDPKMEVPTIYKAYVREYPHKIWPYMVQYLHFRILEFPLTIDEMILCVGDIAAMSLKHLGCLLVRVVFFKRMSKRSKSAFFSVGSFAV